MINAASNVTELIGSTPLVAISHFGEAAKANVFAKLEFFNPGSAVKDRIGKAIVDAAEESGQLPPGGTIVEATSGNTGVALALVGAARGYQVVIAMPSSMSAERKALMRFLGAELVLTDPAGGMKAAVAKAEEIVAEREGAVLASQFANPANPAIHKATTAEEILEDTEGEVDIFIAGVGTGGTISGVGQRLKETGRPVQIIAVEPAESPLLSGGQAGPHLIQGLGANFIPENYDASVVDEVITVEGPDAIAASREAAAKAGLLVGISAGAALAAAKQVAQRPENEGKNIVVLLPDTGERYLSTKLFEGLTD
ncbi:cysteine synthase A [Boudabousia liubingyangii]|uniref:cysteine synthase n=1 Tax=Boudabousia liubingyangii TaxID=1921764 RepID=A0A1Q5PMV7_9ACTO|nr:cysteine synthase A [Boudabousia liubingyangii]OKL47434.1 cysteine synthase A [Boudabousia liubingyangii]OKL48805.1 cysteine synthase A [Boudabousia liubingyangii]